MPTPSRFAPVATNSATFLSRARRRAWICSGACLLVAASGVFGACQQQPEADRQNTGGNKDAGNGGAGGEGGVAGVPQHDAAPKDPHTVTSENDCVYDGSRGPGGANGYTCQTITVYFAPPRDTDETLSLSTDTEADVPIGAGSFGARAWTTLDTDGRVSVLSADFAKGTPTMAARTPKAFTVRVAKPGNAATEKTYSDLRFHCVAHTFDDWCWEAAPVAF